LPSVGPQDPDFAALVRRLPSRRHAVMLTASHEQEETP
jgi:hypothetical protein